MRWNLGINGHEALISESKYIYYQAYAWYITHFKSLKL